MIPWDLASAVFGNRQAAAITFCGGQLRVSRGFAVTLWTRPALAAGVTDRLWEVSDIVELLQEAESKAAW